MPASPARSKALSALEERSIVASRIFEARRDVVWKMWEEPDHIVRWWGPKGFTTTVQDMNFRPGGTWQFVMHGPDGTDYQNKIVYREIVKPERIVLSHVSGPLFDSTVTFEALGGKTRLTVQMVFETAELRDKVAEEYGAVEGLREELERLAALLQKPAGLMIDRLFDAPRDVVFKAWTDPKQMARWWGPKDFTNPVCDLDVRPGGAIRVDMRAPDGTVMPMTGVFNEVDAPERLVFTSKAFDGALEVLNTVTFADENGKTRVKLADHVIKSSPAFAGALAGMSAGWSQSLDKLDTLLTNKPPLAEFVISREFDAPRDLVWKAWTEPERMAKWFGPKGVKVIHSDNDLRPGGIYHYGMRTPDGQVVWGRWIYIDIAKPERLVFVTSFSDEKGGMTRHPLTPTWPLEMLSAILFNEKNGKTTVTVVWSPINATESERGTFEKGRSSMTGGWTGTFEQFEAYLRTA